MFIGMDVGTSGIKAVLVDEAQKVLASHTEKLTVSRPHEGWSEQDPEDWWVAACKAIDALHEKFPREVGAVRGIGLSGQQHGAVLLGGDNKVLRPCMLWNDTRAETECNVFERRFPQSRQITGNIAMPGFTAPKVMWVARHEPDIFGRTRHVLLPKAWLRFRMTGEMIEDMSDASGTLWLDTGRRLWSDAALEACGLRLQHMPELCEGTDVAGRLHADLATRWGMAERPVFAGSAGDNAGGAVGLGATKPGDAFISLGTSGVVWMTTDSFHPGGKFAIHSFCHAVPNTWHQMGVTLSAAASLAWWSRVSGLSEGELLAELPEKPIAPSPVVFAPYLSGERTPHNDGSIRGAFIGLSQDTTRTQMTQAVLEGVAFSFRDALEGLAASGSIFHEADVIGGGSQSPLWTSILATVLDVTLHRLAHGEQGGAFGAARLARIAATGESVESVCTPPERVGAIAPDLSLKGPYRRAHQRYREIYPALKTIHHH
ncbi:glycerol kinase [Neoasaia chiangmaiensis NBRC 101099]|uniref:Xylulose kinase n=1 Tax=Neoasaia chiangmaiensis TaxID=320497 RepID=A0A1U9KRR4_9PROT|nr:xylulokinase [Neoasaia chiangmaiensis]AQS88571.1 xylulokinase [Neoasaia chiangmaiensis]GBR36259.1 glycerol kinase [Neoasaia chiangmaiensis NBRC 101099]GEN15413.1 xylulokinase [Neoasaia chiangmaiensis]